MERAHVTAWVGAVTGVVGVGLAVLQYLDNRLPTSIDGLAGALRSLNGQVTSGAIDVEDAQAAAQALAAVDDLGRSVVRQSVIRNLVPDAYVQRVSEGVFDLPPRVSVELSPSGGTAHVLALDALYFDTGATLRIDGTQVLLTIGTSVSLGRGYGLWLISTDPAAGTVRLQTRPLTPAP